MKQKASDFVRRLKKLETRWVCRTDKAINRHFTTPLRSETSISSVCCSTWPGRPERSPLPPGRLESDARRSRRQCSARKPEPETLRCIWRCRCGAWCALKNDASFSCCWVKEQIRRRRTARVSCRARWPTTPRYYTYTYVNLSAVDRQTLSVNIQTLLNKWALIPHRWNACLRRYNIHTFVHSWWRPLASANANWYYSSQTISKHDLDLRVDIWPWKLFWHFPFTWWIFLASFIKTPPLITDISPHATDSLKTRCLCRPLLAAEAET